MSHEIYYTSAPEGMKRGTSGFCTVAASENIPRSLLDRLESLSAYRHHFPAAVNSQNPVSFAHWLLNIGGTKYHVLSRICDSGVDHTQRTNAFAHHLVVENNEMAPAGPAWMLAQSGIMRSGWDGQVGPLRPRTLPQGDRPAAICRRWAEATGDAGWGGQLADVFIKNPAKPVCLLFGPGQDILSLMAETIALLPPMVRWNATFNTYFTSMPTSATCVWRCCLAGTPAAQVGLRYAAAGLVIDLTDQSRLGAPANGPYVTMARTGQPPAGIARTAPARTVPSAPPKPEPATPRAPATPFPIPPLSPPPEEDYSPDLDAEPEEEADLPMPAAFTAPPIPATIPTSAAPTPRISLPRRLTPIMREADAALQNAERQAALAAGRRRRQVLVLFFGALIAIGLGMALIFALKEKVATEPPPSATPSKPQPSAEAPHNPAAEVPPAPEPKVPPAPVTPAPPMPEVVKVPTAPPPVIPITPAPPTPIIPARQYPRLITCTTTMTVPKAGNGSGDSIQTISFPRDDLRPLDSGEKLVLSFANNKNVDDPGNSSYVLFAMEVNRTVTINWSTRGPHRQICFISLDPSQGSIEIHWKASALLRYPEGVNLVFWALQTSNLALVGPNMQHFAFKPIEFGPFSLAKSDATLTLPMPLPKEAVAQTPTALPKGWKASTYTDWEAKDAAMRKPENAFQVIKLEKPTAVDGISTSFLITLHPGFEKVENTYAKHAAAAVTDLTSAESDFRAITASIDGFLKEGVKENDPSLQPYLQKKDDISHKVDAYKQALAGYKEITNLDVALGMPDGLHLTTLHFQRGDK